MNNNPSESTKKEQVYHKKIMINYVIICSCLVALSFIGLVYNEWVVPVCVGECAIIGLAVMALLIKSHSEITAESGKGSFVIYLVLRFACMIVGIVIACLLVKFTMGEEVNKLRYVIVLIGAIPYFVPTVSLLMTKQND